MLLFHKRDLLVVLVKNDSSVQFTKPIKDILKYQYRYNYKFKMYESGRVTVADDYIIEGETLTVFFGSASVEYTSSGATYNDGGSGGSGGDGGDFHVYEVKPIPADALQPGDAGYYIDGDISEILSAPCMLISGDKRYFPILYLVDSANNEYELDVLVDDSLNVVAYLNGQGYDETWPYNDKLAYIFDGSPIG